MRDLPWLALGALLLFLILTSVVLFHRDEHDLRGLASKAGRVDLIVGIRAALSAASEAEKSAILAADDQEAKTYADQSRAAAGDVERKRGELVGLLKEGGTPTEKDLLERFTLACADFRRVDEKLLALAGKNSNWKAYGLAFGPAAQALQQMDGSLSRLVAKGGEGPDGANVMRLAFEAQGAALRIQTMLAPHIAEESDEKMDQLEAAMAKQDETVRADLDRLSRLAGIHGDQDLATALWSYGQFSDLRKRILALSRENTNVLSTAMSLRAKRKIIVACHESLSALEEILADEPPIGADYGRFGRPREVP